jgi:hypothetical protein
VSNGEQRRALRNPIIVSCWAGFVEGGRFFLCERRREQRRVLSEPPIIIDARRGCGRHPLACGIVVQTLRSHGGVVAATSSSSSAPPARRATTRPSIVTRLERRWPASASSNVVFPAPDGPITAQSAPGAKRALTPSSTRFASGARPQGVSFGIATDTVSARASSVTAKRRGGATSASSGSSSIEYGCAILDPSDATGCSFPRTSEHTGPLRGGGVLLL